MPTSAEGVIVIHISQSEWDDIKEAVRETRLLVAECRDSSRSNGQTLDEVVRPWIADSAKAHLGFRRELDDHSDAVSKVKGALWAIGATFTAITVLGSLWLAAHVH